ncbi:plancitoxin-1 [Glossina fuscipes]|uniref:Plancitoxin-1 n=1 Tax=Glossina fuscipes TaxID=7396 RepID=A0A9C5ZHX4_9MUSC|nr:plancitoxin-1 [Glossina fuscipes]KAI9590699.1 hypothetical protein GQX74_008866 [Glossina fuscipes]
MHLFYFHIYLLVVLLPNFIVCALYKNLKVACKTEQGLNVDWYYLYKLPKHYTSDNRSKTELKGYDYMFATSDEHENWQFSEHKINMPTSMPAKTMVDLFDDASVLLIAYNDEYPNGTVKSGGGHAKGVLATDGVTGFWLIHSVPKFPSIPYYLYPATGSIYGQSFVCITFSASEVEKIAKQLLVNAPNIYFQRVPSRLTGKFPLLESVIDKKWNRTEPYYSVLDINSLENVHFKSFAKSAKYNQELYEDLMAPELGSNLLVESWRNGGGNIASNCSLGQKVYNIQEIKGDPRSLAFRSSQDHSKWAVSQSTGFKLFHWRVGGTSPNWICVGDINRQQGQLNRGGGQLCQKNKIISRLYSSLINDFESC